MLNNDDFHRSKDDFYNDLKTILEIGSNAQKGSITAKLAENYGWEEKSLRNKYYNDLEKEGKIIITMKGKYGEFIRLPEIDGDINEKYENFLADVIRILKKGLTRRSTLVQHLKEGYRWTKKEVRERFFDMMKTDQRIKFYDDEDSVEHICLTEYGMSNLPVESEPLKYAPPSKPEPAKYTTQTKPEPVKYAPPVNKSQLKIDFSKQKNNYFYAWSIERGIKEEYFFRFIGDDEMNKLRRIGPHENAKGIQFIDYVIDSEETRKGIYFSRDYVPLSEYIKGLKSKYLSISLMAQLLSLIAWINVNMYSVANINCFYVYHPAKHTIFLEICDFSSLEIKDDFSEDISFCLELLKDLDLNVDEKPLHVVGELYKLFCEKYI